MSLVKITTVRLADNDLDSMKVIELKHGKHVHLSQSDLIKIALNEYADTLRKESEKEQVTEKTEN